MNTTVKHLERAALVAHQAGLPWSDFWQEHGAAVCRAEPHNRQRFQRLVRMLLHLVASGDPSGMEPAGEPWLLDDTTTMPVVADTGTAARIDWQAAGISQEMAAPTMKGTPKAGGAERCPTAIFRV
jgi:hypothetical protein